MTIRPVIIPRDKRETPPNAIEEAEELEDSTLSLALWVTLDGVAPSMSQESQFSEF